MLYTYLCEVTCAIQVGNAYEFKLGFQKLNQNCNFHNAFKYYYSILKREFYKEIKLIFAAVWTRENTLIARGS